MNVAVRANVRTTAAAERSLDQGLRVAFASGTVMGTMVVGLALLGISVLYYILTTLVYPMGSDPVQNATNASAAASALAGFGFGGTSIAIFARVGGGIFTKAADVGADLVGIQAVVAGVGAVGRRTSGAVPGDRGHSAAI